MLFNSLEFIFLFLPSVFFIYFYLNKSKLEYPPKIFLVFSSLLFYSWWNPKYLLIIIISMIFNYLIGTRLAKRSEYIGGGNKNLLLCGILGNISLLGYFKYSDFFIVNLNNSIGTQISLLNLVLPLAISFFTFQQIAYLVDCFHQKAKKYDFLNYSLFVSFFPQLIAGPIVHHNEMMPQFYSSKNKVINHKNIAAGFFLFSIGLFKKVVIADNFAIWANLGFDNSHALNIFEGWVTSLSYTFQLYFDFSGYTDMAIGTALLFNIVLPINFNSPYKSKNIQEFWKRWHITLSRFLKDYIYIPLVGNRKSNFITYRNMLVTFILGGFWHGAGWTFLFWGFLHGLAIIIYRIWFNLQIRIWGWLSWFITFNFINISWIFFRAKTMGDATNIITSMFNIKQLEFMININIKKLFITNFSSNGQLFNNFGEVNEISILGLLLIGFLLVLLFTNSTNKIKNLKFSFISALATSLAFCYSLYSISKTSEFLYFNF